MPTPWTTLSTTTGWPYRSVSLAPICRAIRSGLPPAAVGMMMRRGRDGQAGVCAEEREGSASAAAPPATNVLRVCNILLFPPQTPSVVSWSALGRFVSRPILAHWAALVQSSVLQGFGDVGHERCRADVRCRRHALPAPVQGAPARAFCALAHRSRCG